MKADLAQIFTGRNAGITQVERACKAILRTIWVGGMRPGDRLPSLRRLAATLEISNNTLIPALDRLEGDGVLERRPRRGLLVLNPDARPGFPWRIGILENLKDMHTASPFASLLGACIQDELIQGGGWPRLYFHQRRIGCIPERLGDYPDFVDDAKRGILDGAVSLGNFDPRGWDEAARGMPLCGFAQKTRNGAMIDLGAMRDDARKRLSARGCRRISQIDKGPGKNDFLLRNEADQDVSFFVDPSDTAIGADYFLQAGHAAARMVLRLPARRRPDGFVFFDDYLAAGFTQCIRDSGDWRPPVAVLTHVQNPLVYSIPILRFEVDILTLVQAGVAVLIEQLRNPVLPPRIERISPRFVPTKTCE